MNLGNYAIGLLLLIKWAIRYKTGYFPSRWETQKSCPSIFQPPKGDWCTNAVFALTFYMLGYILISIFNARSNFNKELKFFENYNDNYIKWLPHTYDKSSTIHDFLIFLGLACCFWGVRDWLLGKTSKEIVIFDKSVEECKFSPRENFKSSIPTRLKRLLWLLCISGGLLSLTGIIQRIDGTPNIFWVNEPPQFETSNKSFGPFGYRSNGASYLNMVLPISIALLMWATQNARISRSQTRRKDGESHLILFPAICMMLISTIASSSRGGFLVFGFLLVAGLFSNLTKPYLLIQNLRLNITILVITVITSSYYIGWETFFKRFAQSDPWHETRVEQANTTETITYECNLPAPPYDQNVQLFLITNSKVKKFRKGFLKCTLHKNGNLQVLLYNDKAKSHINSTFTNLTDHLETGFLKLIVERGAQGLSVYANDKALKGIEDKTGPKPPFWSHPIIPSEVYLDKTTAIKGAELDLESHILMIQPNLNQNAESALTKKSVKIDLRSIWSLEKFKSLSSSRYRIYEDSWRMAKDYQWMGCGTGAWSTVYFLYHDADEIWAAWVHCDWLEYLITFGLFGFIPGVSLMVLTVIPNRNHWKLPSTNSFGIGLNLAIAGCLIHALFDFPLRVVSIMHIFVILCAAKMVTGRRV